MPSDTAAEPPPATTPAEARKGPAEIREEWLPAPPGKGAPPREKDGFTPPSDDPRRSPQGTGRDPRGVARRRRGQGRPQAEEGRFHRLPRRRLRARSAARHAPQGFRRRHLGPSQPGEGDLPQLPADRPPLPVGARLLQGREGGGGLDVPGEPA